MVASIARPTGRLAALEAIVDAGLQTFVEVGQALAEIREERLYKESYATFEDYCAQRFGLKRQRAYEIMGAAAVVTKMSEISDKVPDRESHAAALADLQDDPPAMVEAFNQAVEATEGRVTAAAIEHAVEEIKPKPASLSRSARSATRNVVEGQLKRRSVSSRAEAGDYADDAPTYEDQSQDAYGEPDANNETRRAPADQQEHKCYGCGDKYRGTHVCPMAAPTTDDPYAAADPLDGLTPHPDGESGPILADTLTGEDALTPDQPGATEITATEAGHPAAMPEPPAVSRAVEPAQRTGSVSLGRTPHVAPSRPISERRLDAGDLARALLDQPTTSIVEALAENATPAQKDALRKAFGQPSPAPTPPAPAADPLAGLTLFQIRDALLGLPNQDQQVSLIALVADELPSERLLPLQHRLAVRLRAQGDTIEVVKDLERAASALSPLRRASLANRITETLETPSDVALVANHANARVALLQTREPHAVGAR